VSDEELLTEIPPLNTYVLPAEVLIVTLVEPETVKVAKVNVPLPVQLTVQGEAVDVVLQPAGSDPVLLKRAKEILLPPDGTLGETMLDTVLSRLTAPVTPVLLASGSKVNVLL
jgi:hypothetical protein